MRRCFSCSSFNRPPLMHGRIRQKYDRVGWGGGSKTSTLPTISWLSRWQLSWRNTWADGGYGQVLLFFFFSAANILYDVCICQHVCDTAAQQSCHVCFFFLTLFIFLQLEPGLSYPLGETTRLATCKFSNTLWSVLNQRTTALAYLFFIIIIVIFLLMLSTSLKSWVTKYVFLRQSSGMSAEVNDGTFRWLSPLNPSPSPARLLDCWDFQRILARSILKSSSLTNQRPLWAEKRREL